MTLGPLMVHRTPIYRSKCGFMSTIYFQYYSSLYFVWHTAARCTIFNIVNVQLQQLREVQTEMLFTIVIGLLSTCNFGHPSIPNNPIYFWMLFYFQVVVQLAYHSQGRRCFVIMRAKSRPTMSTLVPALTCFIKMLKLRLIARWGSALRCLRTSKYSRPRNQS